MTPKKLETVGELAQEYLTQLDKAGKSSATVFGYGLELRLACSVLGAETLVSDLTTEQVQGYYQCNRVTRTRDGRPKSKAGVAKTRRVLRQALAWAEEKSLVVPKATK